jgi:uncharacterized protein YndB with AHSA1/START domain
MRLARRSVQIGAPPSLVYKLLTDPALFIQWMAESADIDARPGGRIRWTHPNGDSCSGHFVELVAHRRIVFTYGWERPDVEIPPGSTTVEIDLVPLGGGTEVRLVHRGLSGPMADAHGAGWVHYLARLASRAEGRDPGPDPWADRRVPAARQLELP